MSQQDVIDTLEKAGKPLSRSEIAAILNCNPCKVSHAIKRLIDGHDIKILELNREQAKEGNYHPKRRMRLYYIEVSVDSK